MVAGGERRKDIKLLSQEQPPTNEGYNCSALVADLPNFTKGAVGLLNGEGKPMVCGGDPVYTDEQGCYVYEVGTNEWVEGPRMVEPRYRAVAATLEDGTTWIFGGMRLVLNYSNLDKSHFSA